MGPRPVLTTFHAAGTAGDVSSLVDYIPPLLFPNSERTIDRWLVAGGSLGGHAAWWAGAHDPRLTHIAPLVASPSLHTLLGHRARNLDVPIAFEPPIYPTSLREFVLRTDPDSLPAGVWKDKHILVISGADDDRVNYVDGGSEAFVEKLKGWGVDVQTFVEPGVGHHISRKMVETLAEWVARTALQL
jgi:dipeptidyl aminopeptidase/acylaminoacyl peptidase